MLSEFVSRDILFLTRKEVVSSRNHDRVELTEEVLVIFFGYCKLDLCLLIFEGCSFVILLHILLSLWQGNSNSTLPLVDYDASEFYQTFFLLLYCHYL